MCIKFIIHPWSSTPAEHQRKGGAKLGAEQHNNNSFIKFEGEDGGPAQQDPDALRRLP